VLRRTFFEWKLLAMTNGKLNGFDTVTNTNLKFAIFHHDELLENLCKPLIVVVN
jgi:hypothetical protein